jgi:ankyrin repeat protein
MSRKANLGNLPVESIIIILDTMVSPRAMVNFCKTNSVYKGICYNNPKSITKIINNPTGFSEISEAISNNDFEFINDILNFVENDRGLIPILEKIQVPIPRTTNIHDKGILLSIVRRGNVGISERLINLGFNLDIKDTDGNTPLHLATSINNKAIIEMLLKIPGIDKNAMNMAGSTALHIAVINKSIDSFDTLIENDVDTNIQNNNNNAPIHYITDSGAEWNRNDEHILNSLVDAGADIDLQGEYGNTPIHLAIQKRNTGMFNTLISAGADYNISNERGYTPFFLAVNTGIIEIITKLLDVDEGRNTIDVNATDNIEQTPLFISLLYSRNDIVKLLIPKGARIYRDRPLSDIIQKIDRVFRQSQVYQEDKWSELCENEDANEVSNIEIKLILAINNLEIDIFQPRSILCDKLKKLYESLESASDN